MIRLENFSVYYKVKGGFGVAVDDVSLSVPQGQFLVIMGSSGCGKTTLLKSVLGLCDYVEGTLSIDGKDWKDFDKRKNTIAYVSQDFVLYPHLTVYDNIAFPLRSSKIKHADRDPLVREIAKQVGLEKLLTRLPKQLSIGQQQKLCIARALVKKPKIVLYDEPFSNMDHQCRQELRELIGNISRENGQTVLYVTHDPEDARELADRVIYMEEGKILEESCPEILPEERRQITKRKYLLYAQKASGMDYTAAMLPHSRKAIFYDVIKLRGWKMFQLGLILLAFAFPIHLLALLQDVFVAHIHAVSPALPVQELTARTVSFQNIRALINIPLLVLFSVGFSGVSHILRQYGWGENVDFVYDFCKGIRQNSGQMAFLAICAGVINLLCTFCKGLSYTTENVLSSYFVFLPTIFSVGILLPIGAYMTVCIPVYSNSFRQNLKLGAALYLKYWKKTIPIMLFFGSIFLIFLIPSFYCHLFGRLIASLLIPVLVLGFNLFAYERLDESVNPRFFPELVGKGTILESDTE